VKVAAGRTFRTLPPLISLDSGLIEAAKNLGVTILEVER